MTDILGDVMDRTDHYILRHQNRTESARRHRFLLVSQKAIQFHFNPSTMCSMYLDPGFQTRRGR
jgi:hypothetical protein